MSASNIPTIVIKAAGVAASPMPSPRVVDGNINNQGKQQLTPVPPQKSKQQQASVAASVAREENNDSPDTTGKSDTEQLHDAQLSTPYIARAKYLQPKQLAFGRTVVQKLMILSPHLTREQVRAYNDEDKLEQFKKFCHRVKLKEHNYERVVTIERLENTMRAIKTSLKFVIKTASFLNLLARRLLRCTRIVQAFCRRALKKHRENKLKILEHWKEVESVARRKIRTEVEYWASRSKSATSQRSIEEMWEVYMKCWVSKDEMVNAIHSCWLERRNFYIKRFRDWKSRTKANLVHAVHDTMTKKRRREHAAYHAYPFLNFSANHVTILELVAHHDLLAQRKMAHSINVAAVALGKSPRTFPTQVGDVTQLESPVSYYHALLLFDRTKLYLMIFLHQLASTGHFKLPPGPNLSVREQAASAKATHQRWEANGAASAQMTKKMAGSKRRGRAIGPDGQPVGTIQLMREESEAQPTYLAPVAGLRSVSPTTVSQRRSRVQPKREDGGVVPPMSDFGYDKGPFCVSPSRPGGVSTGANGTVVFGRGQSPQPTSPSRARRDSTPKPGIPKSTIGTMTTGQHDEENDPPHFTRRGKQFTTMNKNIIDLDDAERHWKASEGKRMLRRPQSARQVAQAVARGSDFISSVFRRKSVISNTKGRRDGSNSPSRKKSPVGKGVGVSSEAAVVETADKGTSCTTLYDSAAENFYRANVLGLERAGEKKEHIAVPKPKKGEGVETWDKVRSDPDKEKKRLAEEQQRKRIASLRPTIARRAMANLRPVVPAASSVSTKAHAPRRMSWETRAQSHATTSSQGEHLIAIGGVPRPQDEPVLTSRPLSANTAHPWSKLQ